MEHVSLPGNMKNVVTVFCQGHGAPRSQSVHYAGPDGLNIRVSNKQVEHVFNPDAPRLLHNLYTYNENNDIEYGVSYNPFHWLLALIHLLNHWFSNVYGTSCAPHNLLSRINLAGPEDVAQYVLAVKACIKDNPNKKLVLFGTSRGAATVLTSLTKLSEQELFYIGLVIVEAPFASIQSLLYNTWPVILVPYIIKALETFTLFRENQTSPLEAVASDHFPLDMPILFVTSEADTNVPVRETTQLIEVLKNRKHHALTHLQLERSHHSKMPLHDKRDQKAYLREVERLYKMYF